MSHAVFEKTGFKIVVLEGKPWTTRSKLIPILGLNKGKSNYLLKVNLI